MGDREASAGAAEAVGGRLRLLTAALESARAVESTRLPEDALTAEDLAFWATCPPAVVHDVGVFIATLDTAASASVVRMKALLQSEHVGLLRVAVACLNGLKVAKRWDVLQVASVALLDVAYEAIQPRLEGDDGEMLFLLVGFYASILLGFQHSGELFCRAQPQIVALTPMIAAVGHDSLSHCYISAIAALLHSHRAYDFERSVIRQSLEDAFGAEVANKSIAACENTLREAAWVLPPRDINQYFPTIEGKWVQDEFSTEQHASSAAAPQNAGSITLRTAGNALVFDYSAKIDGVRGNPNLQLNGSLFKVLNQPGGSSSGWKLDGHWSQILGDADTVVTPAVVKPEPWTCGACTLSNEGTATKCATCGANAPSNHSLQTTQSGTKTTNPAPFQAVFDAEHTFMRVRWSRGEQSGIWLAKKDTATQAFDFSGMVRDATAVAMVDSNVLPVHAYSPQGDTNRVVVLEKPYSLSTYGELAIELWVQCDPVAVNQPKQTILSSGEFEFYVVPDAQELVCTVGTNQYVIKGTSTLADGKFHHVALVLGRHQLQILVDDVVIGQVDRGEGDNSIAVRRSAWLSIGGCISDDGAHMEACFHGVLLDFRVWSSLSARTQYSRSAVLSGSEPSLIGYFPLIGDSHRMLFDASKHDNHATVFGSTATTAQPVSFAVSTAVEGIPVVGGYSSSIGDFEVCGTATVDGFSDQPDSSSSGLRVEHACAVWHKDSVAIDHGFHSRVAASLDHQHTNRLVLAMAEASYWDICPLIQEATILGAARPSEETSDLLYGGSAMFVSLEKTSATQSTLSVHVWKNHRAHQLCRVSQIPLDSSSTTTGFSASYNSGASALTVTVLGSGLMADIAFDMSAALGLKTSRVRAGIILTSPASSATPVEPSRPRSVLRDWKFSSHKPPLADQLISSDFHGIYPSLQRGSATGANSGNSLGSSNAPTIACTRATSDGSAIDQPTYGCQTCGVVHGAGICHICAAVCHQGHELVFMGSMITACACSMRTMGQCACATPIAPPESWSALSAPRVARWYCNRCTVVNAVDQKACSVCDNRAPDQAALGLAPTVAEKNPTDSTSRALVPVETKALPIAPATTEWACPACTYLNAALVNKCVICDTSNPTPPSQGEKPASKDGLMTLYYAAENQKNGPTPDPPLAMLVPSGPWTCSACTMKNEPANSSCFMCQTAKPMPPAATPVAVNIVEQQPTAPSLDVVPMEIDSTASIEAVQAIAAPSLPHNILRLREAQLQRALCEVDNSASQALANASSTSWDTTVGILTASVASSPQIAQYVEGEYVEKDGYVKGLAKLQSDNGRWKLEGRFKKLIQSQENAVSLTWDSDGSKFTGKWFRGDGSGVWKCLASPLVNDFRGVASVDPTKPSLGLQPYYSGLINMKQNLTNVCYQNSFLQSLFLTQAFRNLILSSEQENYLHLPDESGSGSQGDVLNAVQGLFARLIASQRPELDSHVLQRCLPATFQAGRQQDTSDFAHFLIDSLSQQLSQHETTAHGIDSVFGGTQATILACKTCGKKSINREYFWELLLNLIDLRYTPITSICAVTGTSAEISTPTGYERINSDLNKDRNNAPYVYLCVKRKPENATNELPITDLVVKVVNFADAKPVLEGYERVELDLNVGGSAAEIGGKKQVYLFYKRERNGSPITDLQVIYGTEAVPDGCKQIRVDLNQGDGAKVFLCYRCDMPITDIKIVNSGIPGYRMVEHMLNRSNEDAVKQYLAFQVGGADPCITDLRLVAAADAAGYTEQGWEVLGSPSSATTESETPPDVLVVRRGHGNPIFAIDVFRAPREVPRYNDYEVIDLYKHATAEPMSAGSLVASLKGDWLAGEAVDRSRKSVRIHSISDPIPDALVVKGSFDDKGEVNAVATAATSSWSTVSSVAQGHTNRVLRLSGYWKSIKVKQPQLLDLELRRGSEPDAMYTLTGTIGDGRGRSVAVAGVQTSRNVRVKWPISQIFVLRGDERVPDDVQVVRDTCSGKSGNLLAQTQSPHTLYLAVKREETPSEGYIGDVCVIYGEIDAIPEHYTCVSLTPAGHSANLNDGTAGVPIFICYRRVASETEKRLMDLALMWTSGAQADTLPTGFTKIQHTPLGMDANLNQGTNGVSIHLCFAKCDPGDVVKPIEDEINGTYELTPQPTAGGAPLALGPPLIAKFIRLAVAERVKTAHTLEGKFGTVSHGYLPGMVRGTMYASSQRKKRVITGVWMSDQQNASSMIDFVPPSYPFEWTLNDTGNELDGWWSGPDETPAAASSTPTTTTSASPSCSSVNSSSTVAQVNSWKLMKDEYVRVAFKKDYGTEWKHGELVSSERVWRHDVDSMLSRFVASRTLGGDNLISCTQCERKTETRTNTVVVAPPAHLIITVKRMYYDWVQQKTRKCLHDVAFRSLLTLPSLTSEDEEAIYPDGDGTDAKKRHRRRQYGLYGVLVHSGLTANSGHYFSFCRENGDRTGQLHLEDSPLAPWIKFNDSRVERSSWAEINHAVSSSVSDTVYLLLYKKLSYVVPVDQLEPAVDNVAMEVVPTDDEDEAMLLAKAMALSMSAASQQKQALEEETKDADEDVDEMEDVKPALAIDRRVIHEVEAANLAFMLDTMRASTSAVHIQDLHEFLSLRFGVSSDM